MFLAKDERLDVKDAFVSVGPVTLQRATVFWSDAPENVGGKDILQAIAEAVPGVFFIEEHTGTRSGYGHGRETLRLVNADASPIFERVRVDHCDGPGYSCSYSHGPWYEHGQYNGSAKPDPELVAVLENLEKLSKRFTW